MLKLNLGCGYKKEEGFVNVDEDEHAHPDVVHDISVTPWPFEENSVDEILLTHVLEHIAPDPKDYLSFWKEMYRVCVNDAAITIAVPYWRHDNFFHDPTHIRPITPVGIAMFDQVRNQTAILNNDGESKLGLRIGVDFELMAVKYDIDSTSGEVSTCHYKVRAVKPGRVTTPVWHI
jgi:hypothetical protein